MKVWRSILVAVLFVTAPAGAEPVSYVIEITAAGAVEPVTLIEARTRALLRDYPVQIEWSVRAGFRPRDVFEASHREALTRIWLDLRESTRAVLYVVDDAHDRFLVRVVPLEAGYDEVAGESLGTIIQSSVEVLLAGATLGVSREAAEVQVSALEEPDPPPPKPAEAPAAAPPPPAPTAPAPAAPRYRIALDVSYRGQMLSGGPELLQGPELGASWVRPGVKLSGAAFLSGGYRLPLTWEEAGIGARFQGLGIRGGAGVRFGLGTGGSLAVLGSVGVDGLEVRPLVSDAAAAPRSAFWVAMPTLGLHLEGAFRIFRGLSAWASTGAEVDLMGHHFDVLEEGQPVTVLQTWTVQPVLRLGVRISFP